MQSNNDRGWAVTFLLTALLLSPACSKSPETPPSDTTPIVDMGEPPADMTPRGSCNWMEHVQDNQCVPCPKGTERLAGDDPSGPDTECEPTVCEENQYVVDERCVPCPPGSTREAGDVEFGPNTACEATLCNTNERVSAHECIPCRAGTINAPFDDATGDSTLCDPLFCPPDHKVVDHRCVNCEPGGINEAGDSAAGGDTRCDVREYCMPNHHVSGGKCVACAPGTYNINEEPSNGGDTSCEPTLCELNFFVRDHLCVPCPEFHRNEAGDDSSGLNTECQDLCDPVIGVPCQDFFKGQIQGPEPQEYSQFGQVMALDADTLVIGAPRMDHPPRGTPGFNQDSGAVYIFTRDGERWREDQILHAPVPDGIDMFGSAVALEGDTLIIGAPREDSDAEGVGAMLTGSGSVNSGAAYVYRRIDGLWTFEVAIKPPQPADAAYFGHAIALHGETLVITAPERTNRLSANYYQHDAGAAYVYERSPQEGWVESATLFASNIDLYDRFGIAVDIHDGRIAIGAPDEASGFGGSVPDPQDNTSPSSGAIYIFEKQGKQWVETQYIKALHPGAGDLFGSSLVLQGTRLIVGAPGESSSANTVGGDQLLDDASEAGAVYIFEYTETRWEQRHYLKAPNADEDDNFGESMLLAGDRLFIGAISENGYIPITTEHHDLGGASSGAVYLFEEKMQTWSFAHYLKSPSPVWTGRFGISMALVDDQLLVGEDGAIHKSPLSGNERTGSVSIFDLGVLP